MKKELAKFFKLKYAIHALNSNIFHEELLKDTKKIEVGISSVPLFPLTQNISRYEEYKEDLFYKKFVDWSGLRDAFLLEIINNLDYQAPFVVPQIDFLLNLFNSHYYPFPKDKIKKDTVKKFFIKMVVELEKAYHDQQLNESKVLKLTPMYIAMLLERGVDSVWNYDNKELIPYMRKISNMPSNKWSGHIERARIIILENE